MNGFVSAYSKATGKKQSIPEHWLNDPVLGKRFELTPSTRDGARDKAAKKTAAPPPDTTSQTPDADHPAADKTPA